MTLPAVAVFVGSTLAGGQSLAASKKSLPLWPVREAVLVEVMGSSRGPSDGGASVQQVGAVTRQSSGKSVSDSGDPLGQDREAVRKASPKSCRAGASCASQTAPAQVLRKLGLSRPNGPGNPVSRRRVGINTNTQQPAEGLQHTLVVPAREGESLAWRDGAQQMVNPGDRTEKQEEPGRLRRRNGADLLQERILVASFLFGNFADKAVVAYRGAHHNDPVVFSWEVGSPNRVLRGATGQKASG